MCPSLSLLPSLSRRKEGGSGADGETERVWRRRGGGKETRGRERRGERGKKERETGGERGGDIGVNFRQAVENHFVRLSEIDPNI
jgi:hypothetical protein